MSEGDMSTGYLSPVSFYYGRSRLASGGDPCPAGSEVGGGPKTAPDSSAKSRVKNDEPTFGAAGEADNFRIADNPHRAPDDDRAATHRGSC